MKYISSRMPLAAAIHVTVWLCCVAFLRVCQMTCLWAFMLFFFLFFIYIHINICVPWFCYSYLKNAHQHQLVQDIAHNLLFISRRCLFFFFLHIAEGITDFKMYYFSNLRMIWRGARWVARGNNLKPTRGQCMFS